MSVITKKSGQLEYLTAQEISAPHCFTTRLGGVSEGAFASMNIAIKEGEREEHVRKNLEILGQAIGFSTNDLVLTRQTHSDIIRVVTREDHREIFHRDYPECDGLVTKDPGVALMIFTADCTPILLHDPVTGAVGAAHGGWRGTAAAIGSRLVEAMVENFGSRPEDLRAAIGPNIGMCCFETDADVPEAILAQYGAEAEPFIRRVGEKFYLDLKQINALSLKRMGVTHIDISCDCTKCSPHRYWSHRLTGNARGSQGAIIVCKEGSK